MICFPEMFKIFRDNLHHDHRKFRIDIISLKEVTGGSCALEIPYPDFLSLYVNISA